MRKSLLLTLVLLVMSTCFARLTAANVVDLGEMQLDTDYTLTGDFSDYTGSFVAPRNGTLTVTATSAGSIMRPYSDAECTQEISHHFSYIDGGATYDITVEAGVRYYFYKNFCMDSGTLRLSMEDNATLTLSSASPEAGTPLSASGGGLLSFSFNKSVSVESADLIAGNNSYPLTVNTLGASAIIDYKATLMQAYEGGTAEGDELTVRLTGVCASNNASVKYGETGVLEMKFTAAARPVSLVALKGLSDGCFLSYWVKGDTAAVLTMTFDGALLNDEANPTVVRLEYGNSESETGDYYTESLPFTIDGGNLSIDFSGKIRRPQDMLASGTNYGAIALRVINVRDAAGNFVYSPSKGTIGSFSYGFDYAEVVTNIISEFTPATGADLAEVDSIEVWIADYASVRHDGFKYTCTVDGTPCEKVVTDYSARPDTDYEGAWVFMVPVMHEEFLGHDIRDLTLTLNNPAYVDGLDHSADITATYSLDLTAIGHVTTDNRPATWFDLSGRRTDRPTRGIYVRPGHKVLVR